MGRLARALPAVCLIALTLAPQQAVAHHDGLHLEVTPEVQEVAVGSSAVLTAVLVGSENFSAVATSDTRIDFENEDGAGDWDGVSLETPDHSCVIPAGSSTCTIEIEARRTGTAQFRAWIDTDGTSTHNADAMEGRFAGTDDCDQQQDVRSDCSAMEMEQAPTPGTNCPPPSATAIPQLPGSEPDCTDVVEINFIENAAGTLDCDDSNGPDTERESNPSGAAAPPGGTSPSDEVYTCTVRDEFGNLKGGATVFGEMMGGPNDRDNGASFTSADYTCPTEEADDPLNESKRKGRCAITVTQVSPPRIGRATICFWVGTLSDGAELCASETVDKGTTHDGGDQGDNNVDLVEITWENITDLVLDCDPENGFSLVDSTGTVDCVVLSQISGTGVEGITVRSEVAGANDPDDSDSPQTPDTQPDDNGLPVPMTCRSAANGSCRITHEGEDAGESIYRVWIDDENNTETTGSGATTGPAPDYDTTEGPNEKTTPGTTGEPDGTDVVITNWGEGPTTLVAAPKTATAAIGDCHEITLAATDKDGNPAGGVRLDVEQKHEHFSNSTATDEPIVDFCTPIAGRNPSDVDTSAGDLEGTGGTRNTSGTAGGETVSTTDLDGFITIGVQVEPAHGSDGTGSVTVTSWWETVDNDDPNGGEPSDTALVTWEHPAQSPVVLQLTPDNASGEVGDEAIYTATVTENGTPLPGVQIAWAATGTGHFTWTDTSTDAQGEAIATISSEERGSMTVTASCAGGRYRCSDTSTQNWGPVMCDLTGTDGADVLTGTDAPETICGFGGNDVIDGGGGDDILLGASGDDELLGGDGDDELIGGAGKDQLDGGAGTDALYGGPGADRLLGGPGADTLYGGGGSDDLRGGSGPDELVGGNGRDSLRGQKGRDTCRDGGPTSKARAC